MSTENTVVSESDRVIIYDDTAKAVIYGSMGWPESESQKAGEAEFAELFEVVKSGQDLFFANPTDSFYQGVEAMRVIRRKADGVLFGFPYWKPIAKYDEYEIDGNGDQHGLKFDAPDDFDWDNDYYPEPFVFLPVEPFTITGYKIVE